MIGGATPSSRCPRMHSRRLRSHCTRCTCPSAWMVTWMVRRSTPRGAWQTHRRALVCHERNGEDTPEPCGIVAGNVRASSGGHTRESCGAVERVIAGSRVGQRPRSRGCLGAAVAAAAGGQGGAEGDGRGPGTQRDASSWGLRPRTASQERDQGRHKGGAARPGALGHLRGE